MFIFTKEKLNAKVKISFLLLTRVVFKNLQELITVYCL